MKIQGIIPPVVTPFKADESLDLPRLKQHIDWQICQGVHGIFVLGTTGECCSLDEGEKQAIIAAAVAHVNKRVPVFAGTGAETTREAIRVTKMAEKEGVDGVSVITPYFIMPNQNEIADHYRRIAEQTSLPMVLYSNPPTCGGLKIDPETVARLAEIKNIRAIKDSSGDMQNFIETVKLVPESFSVLIGRDTLICASLIFGGKGAVPASCNIAPKLCVDVYNQFQSGDLEAAKATQAKLTPVRMSLTLGTAPGPVKVAMKLVGQDVGPSRSPLGPLAPDKLEKMKGMLKQAGLI
ncbi:MAG: 4-hydroxy-tetrahydrodipicolinate synthase [Planctomycetes bacterium]|nr:4-hydroxy-tetrahydrodipicolinate synthase [Planctomycetota bacterium]